MRMKGLLVVATAGWAIIFNQTAQHVRSFQSVFVNALRLARVKEIVGAEVIRHRSVVETDIKFSRVPHFFFVLEHELVALPRFVIANEDKGEYEHEKNKRLPIPKIDKSSPGDKRQNIIESELHPHGLSLPFLPYLSLNHLRLGRI